MANSKGYRSTTRKKFTKPFKRNGAIRMKNYLQKFRIGEIVDIIVDSSIHKGMPHHSYHGKTAKIYNINPRSVGVLLKKQVRNRYLEKRLNVRIEHIRKSNTRVSLVKRIKENDVRKAEAKKEGKVISTKRIPKQPLEAHEVNFNTEELNIMAFDPHLEIH